MVKTHHLNVYKTKKQDLLSLAFNITILSELFLNLYRL